MAKFTYFGKIVDLLNLKTESLKWWVFWKLLGFQGAPKVGLKDKIRAILLIKTCLTSITLFS